MRLILLLLPSIIYSEMSLEEKVGQTLMVHFHGEVANAEAKTLIQEFHVGGIIYYKWANSLTSFEQVQRLSQSLQDLSTIPLLIATDQEGGRVSRLTQGFTVFPGNQALGRTERPELALQCAFAMGQEMLAAGINMNLAPVVDISNHPPFGDRSFGSTPEIVSAFGQSALAGYHRAGLLTCLKHFPGHGAVTIDSHDDLPWLGKSLEELQACELIPFADLAQDTDAIMTAHLFIPSLDPVYCATFSKPILDHLRTLGFGGVILSDSLVMRGALKNCNDSIEEAAILAFNAGCDILLLGGKQIHGAADVELTLADIEKVAQSLIHAVQTERISEERLDASVARILALKEKIAPQAPPPNFSEHQQLVQQIAL